MVDTENIRALRKYKLERAQELIESCDFETMPLVEIEARVEMARDNLAGAGLIDVILGDYKSGKS